MAEKELIELSLITLGVLTAAWTGFWAEKFRSRKELSKALKKAQSAEAYAETARREVSRLKASVSELQTSLNSERAEQNQYRLNLAASYSLKTMRLSALALCAGLGAGSLLISWGSNLRTEVQVLKATREFEIRARVAEARAESLSLELKNSGDEIQALRRNFMHQLEAKAVTAAKLEMLLDQLGSRRIKGALELDVSALKQNLQDLRQQDTLPVPDLMPASFQKV